MSTSKPIACGLRKCIRYQGIVGPPEYPTHVCEAFSLGIPDKILTGSNLHNEPVNGDNGLRYKAGYKVGVGWRKGLTSAK